MKYILNSKSALKCLDNNIRGVELYKALQDFTVDSYNLLEEKIEYDSIICILRTALPMSLKLYELTNKPIGFVSAKRNKDLSVDIAYKNIPESKSMLIIDGWIATGSTISKVCEELGIDKENINIFGLIITEQAIKKIKPSNYVAGCYSNKLTEENYIVPPYPYKPRDGGDDMFY